MMLTALNEVRRVYSVSAAGRMEFRYCECSAISHI